MTYFGLKLGQGLENLATHPPKNIPRRPGTDTSENNQKMPRCQEVSIVVYVMGSLHLDSGSRHNNYHISSTYLGVVVNC